MIEEYTIREARLEDMGPIKEILFEALMEYQITIPDNYPVTDIDLIGKNATALAFEKWIHSP